MRIYAYPLIASSVVLTLLNAQSSLATEVKPSESVFSTADLTFVPDKEKSEFLKPSWDGKDILTEARTPETSLSSEITNSPLEIAQTPPGRVLVPNPEVIVQENIPEGTIPGNPADNYLQPQTPVAPVLPRAIAPPVGDMAVSNINAAASEIDLGSPVIIPRLVLQDAPARKVLEVLAEYAGLNLVYKDAGGGEGAAAGAEGAGATTGGGEPTVTLNFTNESIQDVFNTVLLISGLKANRRGRTIFVGANLPLEAQNLISRTLRLNQVKSFNAGVFLASQGAEFQRLVTQTEDITDPLTGRVIGRREVPANLEPISAALEEGATGDLLLTGLQVAADDRLNTITLVGEPRQLEIATSLLVQLDARRRQVAINVKIVDINLNNTQDFSSSFSFGVNDSFFVQDNGAATLRFGSSSPPTTADINSATGRVTNPPIINNPFAGGQTFIIPGTGVPIQGISGSTIFSNPDGTIEIIPQADAVFFDRTLGVSSNLFGTGVTGFTRGTDDVFTSTINPLTGNVTSQFTRGTVPTITQALPDFFQFPQRFLALIEAQITSGNAKILTDPTLVVQEGQEATVKLTQKVIESVNTSVDPLSGVRTTTPVLADAGLTLTVNVDKIDDNGFVNLSVSPTIAAPGATEQFDSGVGTVNTLTLLSRRELTSGLIRLRDGQTLILSGVIQETDQTVTSKVPILGDIPILGALFRSQTDTTNRTEVIIVITPQIMDDNAQFGYNYAPGRDAADVLRRRGYQVPSQ